MRTSTSVQILMIVAGLAVGFVEHLSGATEQRADQNVEGRQVTVKPISQSNVGGDGGNEWLVGGALAGIGLLLLGGLLTGKVMDN